MTKRFAHIHTLVELRRNIRQYPTLADTHIRNTIVESLPPAYRKLYNWINQEGYRGGVTTAVVMQEWDWKPNYASTMLNELWQFGLLSREGYFDEHGKGYKYTVAE